MAAAAKTIQRIALLLALLLGISAVAPQQLAAADEAVPACLVQTWTHERTDLTLTLWADGTYKARFCEWAATGSFGAADGLLTFTAADGAVTRIPYVCDGKKLILLQKGQGSLVMTAPDTAPSAVPNKQGVLPPAAADKPAIAYAYADKAVVTVELAQGSRAAKYCFTCLDTPPAADAPDWLPVSGDPFRVFKYDGDYNIFVRDDQGRVSDPYPLRVRSGYLYPLHGGDLAALRRSLSDMTAEAGTSVTALNEAVAADIARAGVYTRTGAVTSAVSAVSHMAELGWTVPYQGQGAYQDRDDWGFNPNWGAKLRKPTHDGNGTYYYTGMQCVGSIVWAFKQAGLEISNGATGWQLGRLGELKKASDNLIPYDQAASGDFIQVNQHYELVVDRVDTDGDGRADAYLLYEMENPHLTFLLLSFEVVRYRYFFNMDALYDDTGRFSAKNRTWKGSYRIPRADFPPWLTAALEYAEEDRALDRLMLALGTVETAELITTGR